MPNQFNSLSLTELAYNADEATAHKLELAKLAEKDPEFYKYLQENDKELLDFDMDGGEDDENEDEDEEMGDAEQGNEDEDVKAPTLTKQVLSKWQKALLQVRFPHHVRRSS